MRTPSGPALLVAATRRAESGFTLVEILVAMALLSIVLVGLAALQLTAVRQATAARRAGEAMRLAQSVLEGHQTMSFAVLSSIVPVGGWNTMLKRDGVTQMAGVGVDGEADNGPFTVERRVDHDGGEVVVTVRVSWLDITPDPTQPGGYARLEAVLVCRRAL